MIKRVRLKRKKNGIKPIDVDKKKKEEEKENDHLITPGNDIDSPKTPKYLKYTQNGLTTDSSYKNSSTYNSNEIARLIMENRDPTVGSFIKRKNSYYGKSREELIWQRR